LIEVATPATVPPPATLSLSVSAVPPVAVSPPVRIDSPATVESSSSAPIAPVINPEGPQYHPSSHSPQLLAHIQAPVGTSPVINESKLAVGEYICEWNNCKQAFHTAKSICSHVSKQHIKTIFDNNTNDTKDGILCQWVNCDQMKRQKWSLVNHVEVIYH
jgi:hypothetical protein